MEDKKVDRWLRRQFSPTGWVLLGYYALMNLLVGIAMAGDALGQFLRNLAAGKFGVMPDMNALMGNGWGYLLATAAALTILWAWKGGEGLFARKGEKAMTPGTFLCLLVLVAGAQLPNSLWIGLLETILNLFGQSAMGMMEMVSGESGTVSMFLYSAIAAPIAEEVLFRGFILGTLRPYGKRFSILGSAFLFAMFHGNLLQAPYAFLAGLVLGYTAAEYSLIWSVVLHMFNNLVVADLMSRGLALLPEMTAEMVSFGVLGAFTAGAAVILTLRRREIREFRKGEWMDRRCLRCFFTSAGVLILTVLMGISMILMLVG